jgi:hypothetical protein
VLLLEAAVAKVTSALVQHGVNLVIAPFELFAALCQQPSGVGLDKQFVEPVEVRLGGVVARSVPSVVADIERLISAWGLCARGDVMIVHVEYRAGAVGFLPDFFESVAGLAQSGHRHACCDAGQQNKSLHFHLVYWIAKIAIIFDYICVCMRHPLFVAAALAVLAFSAGVQAQETSSRTVIKSVTVGSDGG